MGTFYDTETIQNDWALKEGLIEPGPEIGTIKEELWEKISQEAKDIFKVIVQTPEEIYQQMGGSEKKASGEEETMRVGKIILYKYIRNRFSCSINRSHKILNEILVYATSALAEEKVYFKNI